MFVASTLDALILNWYRQSWRSTRYVTLKICNNDHADQTSASHELRISQLIATANPSHQGQQFVRKIIDSFEAKGPYGTHVCLVYEPMREPIWMLRRRFRDGRYSSNLLKYTLQYLLSGLDYLHSECHIIHTGETSPIILL
jgi:serine/threonine-protein kinase SRPK3